MLQVDVLSRQAALAEVLQHRIADQEDVLQQLQTELEHVDAQRVRHPGRRGWGGLSAALGGGGGVCMVVVGGGQGYALQQLQTDLEHVDA
jgi:hypothetical protein